MLAARFALELAALVAFGHFAFTLDSGPRRYLAAIALPLLAATLWGTFAVPNDPSRSGRAPVAVSGPWRLLLELAFFGCATWALCASGQRVLGQLFGAAVVVLYVLSVDRVRWLLER